MSNRREEQREGDKRRPSKGSDESERDKKKRRRSEESDEADRKLKKKEKRRSKRKEIESDSEDTDVRKDRRKRKVSESDSEDSSNADRRERRKRRKEKKREERKAKKQNGEESDDEKDDARKKKRLLKEAKKFLKKQSKGQELVLSAVGRKVEPITDGDYFQKNAEFATWLREGRGVFFSDLSSDQAHEFFKFFVTVYNEGKLPDKYYDGITSTHAQRTNFAWAIKGRGETGEDIMAEEDRAAAARSQSKSERKKWKQEQEVLLDEMLPKATGREAALEKKSARREQQRSRDDSPELMRDKDLLGGGDNFQQRLAQERQRREKRQTAKANAVAEKTSAYEAAEQAKLNQFRALIGASGGKISIPKRTS